MFRSRLYSSMISVFLLCVWRSGMSVGQVKHTKAACCLYSCVKCFSLSSLVCVEVAHIVYSSHSKQYSSMIYISS